MSEKEGEYELYEFIWLQAFNIKVLFKSSLLFFSSYTGNSWFPIILLYIQSESWITGLRYNFWAFFLYDLLLFLNIQTMWFKN